MDYNSLSPELQLAALEKEFIDGVLTKKGFEQKKRSLFEKNHLLGTFPGAEDGGISPTNSISSTTSGNCYNKDNQQYAGYPDYPPLLPPHVPLQQNDAPHHRPVPRKSSDLERSRIHVRTQNVDPFANINPRSDSLTATNRRSDSAQIHSTPLSTSPNNTLSNPNSNLFHYRPPYNPSLHHNVAYAPHQFISRQTPGRPPLPPPLGYPQYFPPTIPVTYPIRPAPHVRPIAPIIPQIRPVPPGPITRKLVVNDGAQGILDIDHPKNLADDNASIISGKSIISNPNGQRFSGMSNSDDRPGRNIGKRMSLYNNLAHLDILDPTPNFDPELSKLGGLQFMPFEPRELPFENIDPLNPSISISNYADIATLLRYRGQMTPKQTAFIVLDQKGRETYVWTWEKLHLRAEKISQVILKESGLMRGDRVALIYRKTEILEFLVALYGCFFAGVVAVPINAVEEFKELLVILETTKSKLVLTTEHNHKVLTRDLLAQKKELPDVTWWKTNEYGALNLKKGDEIGIINLTELAYIEYTRSPNGELKGVAISHQTIMSQCNVMRASVTDAKMREHLNNQINHEKSQQQSANDGIEGGNPGEMNDNFVDTVLSYLEPRQQVGLILGALWGVYCGNITIYLGSLGPDVPGLWVNCVSKYKVTIALADYPGLNPIVSSFKSDPSATLNYTKKQSPVLSSLRFLFIDALTIDINLNQEIIEQLLYPLGTQFPKDVLTPLSSLPEHGGMILSFGDLLGVQGLDNRVEGERGVKQFLLDREELKENRIAIVGTGEDQNTKSLDGRGVMKVGAFGFVMPEETTALCLPNTVGEIWVDSPSLSGGFWDLPKHTESIFHARPIIVPGDTKKPEYFEQEFLRTGLLGSLINGQLVIFGLYEHRIRLLDEPIIKEQQQKLVIINWGENDGAIYNEEANDNKDEDEEKLKYKFHYTLDLENTVRRMVEGVIDCVVIEIYIKDQNLPVLIAESSLPIENLTALADEIYDKLVANHDLRLYTISICAQKSLPRTWKNGKKLINSIACKKYFEYGLLQVLHVKTCASETIFDIPMGENTGIWGPNAMASRQEMSNGSVAIRRPQYTGIEIPQEVLDEKTSFNLLKFRSIVDVLLWRTQISPDETAYNILDTKGKEGKPISWKKLNNRIATLVSFLQKKGCKAGDHTVLIFPHGIDFVCSIFACMLLGIKAIPISQTEPTRASEDIPALFELIEEFKISYLLVNTDTEQTLKSKQISNFIKTMSGVSKQSGGSNNKVLPQLINIARAPKYTKTLKESNFVMMEEWLKPQWTAIIMCYFSPDQRKSCVRLDHDTLLALCKVQKETCRLRSTRAVLSCVRHFSGIGFVHTILIGIYLGSPTILITPLDYHTNPLVWFETISKFKIKDTYATFPMLQHAMSRFENEDYRNFSLHHLKNLMIPVDGRPNVSLYKQVVKTFLANRLDDVAVNYVYSHIANPMVTTRSYMCVEPIELYLDLKSLRRGIIKIVDPEDEPFGVLLHDSGTVPVSTQVAIIHPETRRPCLSNEFGEIWVNSDANAKSLHGSMYQLDQARYSATIDGGDPRVKYLRTGDLGFLYTIHKPAVEGTLLEYQCLFFLGPIAETFEVNGLIHFPVDIEFTVERCHQLSQVSLISPDGCVVFQSNKEVVCVVEVRAKEGILNLIPCVMNSILDEHQFIIDVIVFIGPGTLPKSRLGEKQRAKVINSWLSGNLTTLHVHYVKSKPSSKTNSQLLSPNVMLSQRLITTNPSPSPTLDPTQYSITSGFINTTRSNIIPSNMMNELVLNNENQKSSQHEDNISNHTNGFDNSNLDSSNKND
ncbi:11753_t:CDS:10 [Funneliformis geosporum]|uniref:14672_t:CDS:1 n=1 Tax=Funneliformis geosporum TaxID=1117311 RepID=A0A9W4WS22_9GLOM|nr:11753_t:CDS:10 [Funneliformis geosporum]CAI2174583.1 14672_t:CDS:10 [Funneliformis geosporum]